jgi:hypothetical protein
VRRLFSLASLGVLLLAGSKGARAAPSAAPAAKPGPAPAAVVPDSPPPPATEPAAAGEDLPALAPSATAFFPEAPAEAPPPLPRHKGLVLETRLGALAFLGKFGSNLAPPAPWLQTQLGWEFFRWLMVYGYGELAYTGTANSNQGLQTYYFPLYGFGGGLRFTIPVTARVAVFLQGNAGAMSVIVPRDELAFLGFQPAESLGFAVGGRVGVEWYQIDRHMAVSVGAGVRDALNFKIQDGESDLPLMLDAGLAVRYTF